MRHPFFSFAQVIVVSGILGSFPSVLVAASPSADVLQAPSETPTSQRQDFASAPNTKDTMPSSEAKDVTSTSSMKNATPPGSSTQDVMSSAFTSFTLPVNVQNDAKSKTTLLVKIPNSFKPLGEYSQASSASQLMEFIPKEDQNPDSWTQIITVKSYPGLSLKSNKDFLDEIVSGFKAHALKTNLIESDDKKQAGYEEGYRIISYSYNNRDEIVYVYTVSGPVDTAMIQYAMKLGSPTELEKAKEQLKNFMKANVIKQ